MSRNGAYDVAVIGGGIIGVTAAFFLARRGKSVVVLERGSLARGTTGNSFAWINASSKAAGGAYHRLNALGLAGHNELAAEFGEGALGLNPCGQLTVARTADATHHSELRERFRLLQAQDYPSVWVGAAELYALEPSLAFDGAYEGILNYAEMSLDAPKYVRFLAGRLAAAGGEVREKTEALALDMDEAGTIRGLTTSAGTLRADKVLLAAGPDAADELARLTGFEGFAGRFPMRRAPGLLLTTPDLGSHLLSRRVVYWQESPDLHVLPHQSGGLKMGADDTDGVIAEDDTEERRHSAGARLLERARTRIRGLPEDMTVGDCELGVGHRPMPEDGRSIADELPGADGLYLIVTHSGVTLSPVLGRLMAEYMATGARPETLAPFSLGRFPGFS